MKIPSYLVPSVLLIGIVLALGMLFSQETPEHAKKSTARSAATPNALLDWNKEIRDKGAADSYQELLTLAGSVSGSIQHLNAHLYGGALYDELGLPAFSTCGMELNGGCLHEFVGRAIQDTGVTIVKKLSTECVERFGLVGALACQHGIGHGLIGYLGYTENSLKEALSVCSTLMQENPTRACLGGAFMEFNSRTMAEGFIRAFSPEAPFELCEHVDDAYKPACYFWSPTWMLESLFGTSRTIKEYAVIGAYCEHAPETYAASCFEGLGYFAPPSANFDRTGAQALCDAVSSTPEHRASCWGVASEAVGGL